MTPERFENSLLVSSFKRFYLELLRLKAWALESGDHFAPEGVQKENFPRNRSKAQKIKQVLVDFLENQQETVQDQAGGYASRYFRQGQYVMVGLADEVFLNIDWEGRQEWEDNLLESSLFSSQDAGQKIFQNIDTFLEDAQRADLDLGALYLMAIGLGFQGKYRGEPDIGILRTYAKNLYDCIAVPSSEEGRQYAYFFPSAYGDFIVHRQQPEVPDPQKWYFALGGCAVIFMVFSWALWTIKVHKLSPLIGEIQRYEVLG